MLASVLLALMSVPAFAMERPSPAEWAQLKQDPAEFSARLERARIYGNHRMDPARARYSSQKLQFLAHGGDPSQVPPPAWRGMPTSGTNNVLVFLIDFPDEPHVNSYELITNKLFGAGVSGDFPKESLSKFYERSSYGLLHIKGAALGWYRMAHSRDWYTTTYGTGNSANYQIIKEVVDYFDASVDYSQYDNNHDGQIDYFAVLWAGPDNGWANFWWGYQWELFTDLTRDGVQFYKFSWQWESNPTYPPYSAVFTPGVIIHETGHALGLPDYYDYQSGLGPEGGLGGMDMMDSGDVDHNCFSKFVLDWETPTVIVTGSNALPLRAAADYPESVALAKGYIGASQFAEYFMVQNRQKVNNDKNLPGSGLAIWHVDARLNAGGTDYQFDNSYAAHKLLRLMEADGLEEIEAGGNADAGDLYVAGRSFTPTTTPNSLFYGGSNSEVRVTNIESSNTVMTADYSALDNAPVIGTTRVYVTEGDTTNVAVSLFRQPVGDVTVTPVWSSGSPSLYVVGSPSLVFTPTDWATPQLFSVGASNDGDMTNDVAVITLQASGGGVSSSDFLLEQMDMGDTVPPQCTATFRVSADKTEVDADLLFDEVVSGFDASDIQVSGNIPGGASLIDLTDLTGSNRLFRARIAIGSPFGALTLTIPASSVTDMSGNHNPNSEYQFVYTFPWIKADLADTFDGVATSWTRSTNVFMMITTDGWEWGVPHFGAGWYGPATAYSGSNCWGVMKGPFDRALDAWVQAPSVTVGANPVIRFQLWIEALTGAGYLEVNGGSGWVIVGTYTTSGSAWVQQSVQLDNASYGNRTLRFRFRAAASDVCAMYVDDVTVESEAPPAVWVVSTTPASATAGTTVPVTLTVYNSATATYANVLGSLSSVDDGVTIGAGSPIAYGTLTPGALTSGAPVSVQLAEPSYPFWATTLAHLQHVARCGAQVVGSDATTLAIEGALITPSTNLLTVRTATGAAVTNWLGAKLAGDGSLTSCLFQVIYAGSNGVADAPANDGVVTGDDHLLYTSDTLEAIGRFGVGAGVLPNVGAFSRGFAHRLPSNALVFVRAWDAASFATAAAYGDSSLTSLGGGSIQTVTLNGWGANRPAPGSYGRDSDGDSLADGWCVDHGLEARNPIVPLGCRVIEAKAVTGFSAPVRVAVSSNFVFVADRTLNQVQVWNRSLANKLFTLGGAANFGYPWGVAVTRDGRQLAVADAGGAKIKLFDVDPNSGSLTLVRSFGSSGSATGQFTRAIGIAYGPTGTVYVADGYQSGSCNNRIQVFSTNGDFLAAFGGFGTGASQFNYLMGVGAAADGTIYAADQSNHRVQAFAAGSTTAAWAYGAYGTATGSFNRVWDAQPGVGNLLYVTDVYNSRIQLLNVSGGAPALVGVISNAAALGAFNLPGSAAPAPDEGAIYVADTSNFRLLKLKIVTDRDGDGMDDVWEVFHGLNPDDPADALTSVSGDGTSNIGKYRAGLDPAVAAPGLNVVISSLGVSPRELGWLAVSGYVYRLQFSSSLLGGIWSDGPVATSSVSGWLSVTNLYLPTNSVEFMRIQWMNAP